MKLLGVQARKFKRSEHPSQIRRPSEALSEKIRRRVRTATQKERTESRRKEHVLPKELKSNMTKGSIEGNARDIAKKAEADASMQR